MSEKPLPFHIQLREVLRGTSKLVRKHPWMLTPLVLLWYAVFTKEERDEFIRRATGGQHG